MATGPRYKVPFRRRREGRTDYRIRRKLLRNNGVRAVVRRSLKHTTVQFVAFGMEGDSVLASAHSQELRSQGWEHSCSNLPAAYLTGYIAGKKALEAGVERAVLDIGRSPPKKGGIMFAVLAGMLDAGLELPHGEGVLPSEERIQGGHISDALQADFNSLKEKLEAE